MGEERSYLWAVTKTGITSYELPQQADIEAAARRFRSALIAPTQRIRTAMVARSTVDLSQLLLSPVANRLGNKRLVIVSDGILQYVPFTVLTVPNSQQSSNSDRPLIVTHEIVSLPSASTLAVLRRELTNRQPAKKVIAVLADPVFSQDDERVNGKPNRESFNLPDSESFEVQQLARSTRESDVAFQRLPFSRREAEQILSLV